jgi:hypothetical protein
VKKLPRVAGLIVTAFTLVTMVAIFGALIGFLMAMLHMLIGLFGYVAWAGIACTVAVVTHWAFVEDR